VTLPPPVEPIPEPDEKPKVLPSSPKE
jgi:hypothetical protein